jgi:hypothetical protein
VILYGTSDRNRLRLQPGRTHSALAIFIFVASAPIHKPSLQNLRQSPSLRHGSIRSNVTLRVVR